MMQTSKCEVFAHKAAKALAAYHKTGEARFLRLQRYYITLALRYFR